MESTDWEAEPRNPYYHLAMVRDLAMFFGRSDALRRLYTAIRNQQCLSIVGPRRVGKSSLLHAACAVEMQKRSGYDLSNYVLALIDSGEQPEKTHEDFLYFICEQLIAQNQEQLASLPRPTGGESSEFRHFLEQIKARGLHPVVLLDEFEHIASKPNFDQSFFFFLRAQANAGKISYITASKATLDKICHQDLIGSPFFNIFSAHKLGPLTPSEAIELITTPAELAGSAFTPTERVWVQEIAGRHPFFIQRACYFLFEAKCQSAVTAADMPDIAEQVYVELWPHFKHAWAHLSGQQQEQMAWEARRHDTTLRKLPELSESRLFRKFVYEECSIELAAITVEDLDKILDKIDDVRFLGESPLAHLNMVYTQAGETVLLPLERGATVQRLLLNTIEELRPDAHHKKAEAQSRLYQILSLRHKERMKNEEIAARLAISSRHFFRERQRAVKELLNLLLQKEMQSKEEG